MRILVVLNLIFLLSACSAGAGAAGSYRDVIPEGEAAISRGDFKAAYELSLPYAEAGDGAAQFSIAVVMIASDSDTLGIFDEGDYHRRIIFWLERSASNRNASAADLLAEIYSHGAYGEAKDIQKAECWGELAKEFLDSQGEVHGVKGCK